MVIDEYFVIPISISSQSLIITASGCVHQHYNNIRSLVSSNLVSLKILCSGIASFLVPLSKYNSWIRVYLEFSTIVWYLLTAMPIVIAPLGSLFNAPWSAIWFYLSALESIGVWCRIYNVHTHRNLIRYMYCNNTIMIFTDMLSKKYHRFVNIISYAIFWLLRTSSWIGNNGQCLSKWFRHMQI